MQNMFSSVFGMPICKNQYITDVVPVKKHKKTRHQSDKYHARIQKKWVKRFGEKRVPGAMILSGVIYCHPDAYGSLIEQFRG